MPPFQLNWFSLKFGMLLFFILTRVRVYAHLGCGWRSNSNYAIIGGIRCVAQRLSYEVRLAFLFISVRIIFYTLDLSKFTRHQEWVIRFILIPPVGVIWWRRSLAETNRRPFDFAEGESELVSGFNVEYGSGGFALIFIAEYASIIFISLLIVILFFGWSVRIRINHFVSWLIYIDVYLSPGFFPAYPIW